MTNAAPNIWTPVADFPVEPEFYQRVLDDVPTPVVVVDDVGRVVYGNAAMIKLGQWSKSSEIHADLLAYVHPDDVGWIADAFTTLTVVESAGARSRSWLPITLRLITTTGEVIEVEVTGCNRLADDVIRGVLYHVRPTAERSLERRIVAGLSNGAPRSDQLSDIVTLASSMPFDVSVALMSRRAGTNWTLLASSDPRLTSVLGANSRDPYPTAPEFFECRAVSNSDFGAEMASGLTNAGFATGWQIGLAKNDVDARLVAFTTTQHESAVGIVERLETAGHLAAAVLHR